MAQKEEDHKKKSDKLRDCFTKRLFRAVIGYAALALLSVVIIILQTGDVHPKLYFAIVGLIYLAVIIFLVSFSLNYADHDFEEHSESEYAGLDCVKWFEHVKKESAKERVSDQRWREGHYLSCVLVQCEKEMLPDDPFCEYGAMLHLWESKKNDENHMIRIRDAKGRAVGFVPEDYGKSIGILLQNGMRLFGKVYRKKDFYGMMFIIAEVYVGEHR